jgi:hypothetical protein
MGMLGSVILFLLGALACEAKLGRSRPSLRFWLQALVPLAGVLGIGAALNGLFCVIKMIAYLGFIRYAPVVYVFSLGAGLASLMLGVRFGHGFAMLWLGRYLNAKQRAYADRLQAVLRAREETLGYAGLALGLFSALINLVK